jgi:hypothetical protein
MGFYSYTSSRIPETSSGALLLLQDSLNPIENLKNSSVYVYLQPTKAV